MYFQPICKLSAMRGRWSASRPGRFTFGKEPVHVAQEAGLTYGPVWTDTAHVVPTGICSADRAVHSESLCRPTRSVGYTV